jgi:hypothetical protein
MSYKEKLGNASWKFLHVFASGYPNNLDKKEANSIWKFLRQMSKVYPCSECKSHFKLLVKKNRINQGDNLKLYMCKLHNMVNSKLNKSIFNCSLLK